MDTCTEERFLKDVAEHKMTIMRDDGINRHVRFRKPNSSDMFFDLITWQGCLCYTGDMGTYVFRRLDDMFVFFRSSHPCQSPEDRHLKINPSYWSEKLEAIDRCDGLKKYDADMVRQYFHDWMNDNNASEELRLAIQEEIINIADDGAQAVHDAATDFEHEGDQPFQDFWEAEMEKYVHRFIWCCYAMAWGIQQYDNFKSEKKP